MTAGTFVNGRTLWGAVLMVAGLACNTVLGNTDPVLVVEPNSTFATTTGGTAGVGGSGDPLCAPKGLVCTKVDSECIALEDNSAAPTLGLRMSQIRFTTPMLFTIGVVASIIADSAQMNLPECNLAGNGTFSWLLEVDPATGMIKTGGAKPVMDPTAGYCFVNETLDAFPVAPVTFDSGLKDGTFVSATGFDLTVPLYLDTEGLSYLLLPLREVRLQGQLSPDNNCMGKYNATTLDPKANCMADPPFNLAFTSAGTLTGHVTLEEADMVTVEALGLSLCVLLSGDASTFGDGGMPQKCKRDAMGEIEFKGTWCSATNAEADATCADAIKLRADIAASAVKINGDCSQ